MNDPDDLAMRAVAAVVAELVKGDGKALIDWLRRSCSRKTAEAADALVADPDAGGVKKVLEGNLQMDLERSSSLAGELRDLLSQVAATHSPQTAIASGGSTITQIQGNENRTRRHP